MHYAASCRAWARLPGLSMGDRDVPVRPHHPDPGPLRCLAHAILAWSLAVMGTLPCRASRLRLTIGQAITPDRSISPRRSARSSRACFKCHGPEKQRGGLRLDSRTSVLKGGDSGEPAIVPGDPDASALLERVASDDSNVRMPPKGEPLAAGELALLKRWVAEGATWPETDASARAGRAAMTVTAADREHWSFRPLHRSNLPRVLPTAWARTPVDRFLLAALAAKGLTPAPEADRRTLIRRVTFDLAGLPPTPEEVEAFVPRTVRTRMSGWSIACSRRRDMASAGGGTGSTSPATPTATATKRPRPQDGLSLSRLRHPRPQRGHAVRPVRALADRRR